MRLGLISALHQEQAGLVDGMLDRQTATRGMRDYFRGRLWGLETICVLSRLGKVAAAATAATLIERFDVTHIVFTGVAGGADPVVKVGDIVVAEQLVQHDMDCSPLFPRFEIPLTGLSHFSSDLALTNRLAAAAENFLATSFKKVVNAEDRSTFKLASPRVHRGLIASGDAFISSRVQLERLQQSLPGLLAVEMEGAAVAQVCFEFGIPFAVIRTVSDGANEESAIDFTQFVERVASGYAFGIIEAFCKPGVAVPQVRSGN
jgi:adenosylhomocysteine nucleosidase